MAANTTENEKTQAQKDQDVVVEQKGVKKSDVKKRWQEGANYYTLADEFFGFKSEEAVERIRQIIEG